MIWYNFYDYPSRKLKLVGVTGTTANQLSPQFFTDYLPTWGIRVVWYFHGMCDYQWREILPADHTPDALTLQRYLSEMVAAGCSYALYESLSYAVHQHRIGGTYFRRYIYQPHERPPHQCTVFLNHLHAAGFFDAPEEAFCSHQFR